MRHFSVFLQALILLGICLGTNFSFVFSMVCLAEEEAVSRPAHGIPGLQEQLDALSDPSQCLYSPEKNPTREELEALAEAKPVTVTIPKGTYHFYCERGLVQEHFVSNHDQDNPKSVGISFQNLKNVTFDGSGSTFVFHGKMLPVVLKNCANCTLKNFKIDFADPAICQVKVLENTSEGLTIELASEVEYEVKDGRLFFSGTQWHYSPGTGIAFEEKTRRLVFTTSDVHVNLANVKELRPRVFFCPNWKNEKLVPGTCVALRPWHRPACGIFVFHDLNTTLENIQIHYAEGMGVLAQMSENIHLNGLSVCLRGENNTRYFTTQADATHFSGCKGLILSENALYESMMDDAINVHGTYLKVVKRVSDTTLLGQYSHPQTYGFHWGTVGDEVQFIRSNTMEHFDSVNRITAIKAVDQPTEHGAKVFEITFEKPVPEEISEAGTFGIENLTWTPEVIFRKNIIRNNRARGALFSTPKRTVVEENLFDHTSGTAILLCGDCNGWFETGACRDVVIRKNTFVNALTNMFQFTNGVISIYPEIPNLKDQRKYFHGGKPDSILIEENVFKTFDHPILYAKSIDGLTFRKNVIEKNADYPEFHWNQKTFLFERAANVKIEENESSFPLTIEKR
ncbi:MAG: right-handed parallel beta-helix repeat-containing protein [Planctomycetaceae bacterium]|nr:right-handed parallel beta-helix repeat-containing protein [Planctomycetaceae bacterium]